MYCWQNQRLLTTITSTYSTTYQDGKEVADVAGDNVYTIDSLSAENAGSYACVATNAVGSSETKTAVSIEGESDANTSGYH